MIPFESLTISLNCRLGLCEVCNENPSKYTCPRCEIKTCSLKCSKIHKSEVECDGVRDRTKYKPLKQMTTMDFMNDYYFLEEATRFTREIECNEMVKQQSKPNMRFWKLKKEAMNRKTRLYFINCGLSKRKINQSHFKPQEQAIYWTVELVFPNADNVSFRKKICENVKIQDILTKAMESPHFESPKHKQLEFYKAAGASKLSVLLKAEGLKKSSTRFYEMNQKKSLRANLKGKIIIEFPTLHIIMNHTIDDFDVIASDGETYE